MPLLLQPPLPNFLKDYLPQTGPFAWALRILLVAYTIFLVVPIITFTLPISIFLPNWKFSPFPLHPEHPQPHRLCWKRAWLIPVIRQLFWAITSWGLPPVQDIDNCARRGHEYFGKRVDGEGKSVEYEKVYVKSPERRYCIGVLGMDKVERVSVPCFWLKCNPSMDSLPLDTEKGKYSEKVEYPQTLTHTKAKPGEKVILYLVRGGYVRGVPVEGPFSWALCRQIKTRVLGCCYRKATSLANSFPIPLLDALASYVYLIDECGFRSKDVVVVGDSAGGGLAWSLVTYLAVYRELTGDDSLGVPREVVLISPWLDLTSSQPSIKKNRYYDILNIPQLINASSSYFKRYLKIGSTPHPFTTEELISKVSFQILGQAHPLVSPSALKSHTSLSELRSNADNITPSNLSRKGSMDSEITLIDIESHILPSSTCLFKDTRFLFHYRSAEMFADDSKYLVGQLRDAGVFVEEDVIRGGIHVEGILGFGKHKGCKYVGEMIKRVLMREEVDVPGKFVKG